MHRTALIVPASPDSPAVIRPVNAHFEDLGKIVGGWIEAISGDGWTGYINEEGKIEGLPANERATTLAHAQGWPHGDYLVGNAIFLGSPDDEGMDTDVPDSLVAAYTSLFGQAPERHEG